MAAESTSESLLPAFEIRQLADEESAANRKHVVRISANQYESTLQSYPRASLRYLDLDDGEQVTVGSGLELQQRLEDPVPSPRHSLVPRDKTSTDEEKMHTFDIERTAENLTVWRDHAAYSSKDMRRSSESTQVTETPAVQTSNDKGSEPSPARAKVTIAWPEKHIRGVPPQAPSPNILKNIDDVLLHACKGLESHIDGFASFLDLTAHVLRTAAQKTREADTTPIESFLGGMKDVLLEAGQMGAELFREINDTKAAGQPDSRPAQAVQFKQQVACLIPEPTDESKPADMILKLDTREPLGSHATQRNTTGTRDNIDVTCQASAQNARAPVSSSTDDRIASILDLDASNADFTARYPPLTSLKRAKTIGSLRDESSYKQPLSASNEALSRYPTINQLEASKPYSSRHVHPIYPPPPAIQSILRTASSQAHRQPSVEDAHEEEAHVTKDTVALPLRSKPATPETLPGAWPTEPVTSKKETTHDAFGLLPDAAKKQQQSSSGNAAIYTEPMTGSHTANSVPRRANTVTAANPAARLNGPFDPMHVAPGARAGTASTAENMYGVPKRSMTQHTASRPVARTSAIGSSPWERHNRQVRMNLQHPPSAPLRTNRAPMPGSFPYPPVPQPNAAPNSSTHFLRSMRSEPAFVDAIGRTMDCVSTLRSMGYGAADKNEDVRLPMYASATSGNVSEAIEMIEDDRHAAKVMLQKNREAVFSPW
jgi:hypothetical protein